jgi:molybdopterin converting factor small subunit
MIGSLLDKLFVAVGADLTEFSTAMDQAGADAAQASTQIVDSLNDAGQKGGVALSRIADVARTAIAAAGPILGDGLVEGVRAGIAKAVEVGAEEGPWAGITAGAGEALKAGLTEVMQGVATAIIPQMVAAVTATTAWTTSLTALKAALATTIPIIQGVGAAFMSLMLSPLGLIVAAVAAVVAAWYYWDEIKPVIDRVAAAISEWWNANLKPTFDLVMGVVRSVADFFRDYFGAQIENVVKLVKALLDGDFKGAWEAAKAYVMTAINAALKIIETLAPGAIAAIRSLLTGFATWFGDLTSRMIGWGRNIIEGLVRGIMAAPEAVWNALKSVVMRGVDSVREFLGIASPSRLFMEIGGFVTEGLAIGIDAGTSAVEDAMRNLSAVVAEGLDPAVAQLQRNVAGLLDRLFPDQAAARKLEKDYADLDAALAARMISPEAWAAARERLDAEAAALAERAQQAAAQAAENTPEARLGREAGSIIDRVLPDQAQLRKLTDDIAKIDQAMAAGLINPETWEQVRARLDQQLQELTAQMQQAGEAANDNMAEPFEDAAQRVANGIKDMVQEVSSALSGLKTSIQDGDIVGVIEGIANTIVAVIGAISQIKGGFGGGGSSAPTVPGRATGGNVSPFGTFIVGENGPEVLRMGAGGGRVYNATDTQKMLGGGGANDGGPVQVSIAVEASEYFDGRVAKITRPGMAQAAQQGALGGHAMTVKESRRNASRRMPG